MEAAPGLEPGDEGFAGLCLTNLAMPPHKRALYISIRDNVKQNAAQIHNTKWYQPPEYARKSINTMPAIASKIMPQPTYSRI